MMKLERKLKDILNKKRTVTSVAEELQVSRQTIYKWLKAYDEKGSKAFAYRKIKSGIFAEENIVIKIYF
ncbi:MAG: helix-turn-helix domain-containing protein [Candidatus Pacebacteria bacterium]|nr:helix-turn-helix domain-containing protein [Candidatus Paceibacterota bacterium]MBP9867103.1 helix-turn-helix domain-containing protein [Candidatus Paceibacterota bacterium]